MSDSLNSRLVRRRRRLAALAALACGCLLAAAPGALARSNAAVVAEGGATVLRVESADPALALSVRFQPAGALVRVRDGIGGVGAGAGCVQEGADAVCGPVSAIRATGTGLTDLLDNQTGFRSTLVGAGSPDALFGGTAADVLDGGDGNDLTDGREGNDVLAASAGADTMRGGAGSDLADFSGRTTNLLVSLDGLANDGAGRPAGRSEGDQVDPTVESVVGGSGPDTLIGADGAQNRFEGGNGDDTLRADASGNDKLFGQGGNDRLESAARGDRLDGGDGGDTLVPGTGVDDVTGGPGFDSVLYTERTTAVEVTLDDEDNDGGTGDFAGVSLEEGFGSFGDNVHSDVEAVFTGSGNDVLVGSAAANTLDGGPGGDTLDGKAGPDEIQGGAGSNAITYPDRRGVTVTLDDLPNDGDASDGPAGARDNVRGVRNVRTGVLADTLVGDDNANFLFGGPGDDDITGRGSGDILRGEDGLDFIHANDGLKDIVDCGALRDQAELDLADAPVVGGVRQIPATCEIVSIAPVGELPTLEILTVNLRRRGGPARARVRCPRAVKTKRCAGRLTLAATKQPRKTLASTAYSLRRGVKATLRLRLHRTRARKLVAIANGRGPTGRAHVSVRRLTVR